MKKIKCVLAAVLAVMLLTGCSKNPESEIVVHKDMEKVIEEAQQTDVSKADLGELRQETLYHTDLENESLSVKVQADAPVEIPDIDKLSMYRVKQRRFTQEDCDKVRAALMGDAPLTDCTALMQIQTKAEIEEQIAALRESLAEEQRHVAEDADYARLVEQNTPDMLADLQKRIDERQAYYEAAPDSIDYAA